MKKYQKYFSPIAVLIFVFHVCCLAGNIQKPAGVTVDPDIEKYLGRFSDSGFAFSVLVAEKEKIIHMKGYGWTDSSRKTRVDERTLFNIASITKSFTAVAIFKLIEMGTLSPGDSVTKFFNNVPPEKRGVTISHLLTHSSGLGQNYAADGIVDRDSAVKIILSEELEFEPGKEFSYSNENYELLGAVVEVTTGKSYENFVSDQILIKAGMLDTRFWGEQADDPDRKVAAKTRALDRAILTRNWGYIASGGIYSNLADLFKWFDALKKGKILGRKSLERIWTPARQLKETDVAYGWFVSSSKIGKEIWTRGTEDWGHNGVIRWFPEPGLLIIVLSNSGERGDKNITANRFISDGILELISGK